jgi:hypothetical protein
LPEILIHASTHLLPTILIAENNYTSLSAGVSETPNVDNNFRNSPKKFKKTTHLRRHFCFLLSPSPLPDILVPALLFKPMV